jgi:hypothetical protein
MDRFIAVLAAVVGLTITVGPALIAQTVPRAEDLKLCGVLVLGTLVGMSACARPR